MSSGASASAANPGSNIEAYFKPYHNWVEGDQGGRPIDILLRNLNEVRESLLVVANYPSQSGPANEKLRLQVVNLRGTVSRLPKPFARMISESRRGIRRRGGRQLEGADERRARPTSPNSASAWS